MGNIKQGSFYIAAPEHVGFHAHMCGHPETLQQLRRLPLESHSQAPGQLGA